MHLTCLQSAVGSNLALDHSSPLDAYYRLAITRPILRYFLATIIKTSSVVSAFLHWVIQLVQDQKLPGGFQNTH